MIADLRPDGILYVKINDEDSYKVTDDNGVEIFFNPDQVEGLRAAIRKPGQPHRISLRELK